MAKFQTVGGKSYQVGDTVWWYGTRRADGDPLAATVISFAGGTAFDLHVHVPGRITLCRCVRHVSDPALAKVTEAAVRETGVWRERTAVVENQVVTAPPPAVAPQDTVVQPKTEQPGRKPTVMEKLTSQPLKTSP